VLDLDALDGLEQGEEGLGLEVVAARHKQDSNGFRAGDTGHATRQHHRTCHDSRHQSASTQFSIAVIGPPSA